MRPIGDLRTPIKPSEDEIEAISRLWIALLRGKGAVQGVRESLEADRDLRLDMALHGLPPSVTRALSAVLEVLVQGDAVAIVPVDAELSTQEAADLLGVSRPFLVRLIEQGKLSCRWVGSHRRLRVADVLAYRRGRQFQRHEMLREHSDESERLGLFWSGDEQEE
jgi:excisionase family DNA binding protein